MRNKPTRFYSNRQEKAVAKSIDGKQVANSGAARFVGGDVSNDNFLIECKTTTAEHKKSFSIKEEWLTKIADEAIGMRKQGFALCFDFGEQSDRYYVISEKMFKRLNRYLSEDE